MAAETERLRVEEHRLIAANERLRARLEEVESQLADAQARLGDLEARDQQRVATIRRLEKKVAELEALVEKLRREGKRQAAPFRKAEGPKPDPKKPGRRPGAQYGRHAHREAPPPELIDEEYEAKLPERCPACGSTDLQEEDVVAQYQTELPCRPIHRRFTIHRGACRRCGQRVQGRHPLQTSDAVGAAASQLGPRAHAAMAMMNKELGLSHGKVARFFRELFGISIARATSARSMLRTADRCRPAYEEIRAAVRASERVMPDETGWRIGGRPAWLHVVVGPTATCYVVARSRGHEVLAAVLGPDWSGTMTHDGWGPYDCFRGAFHQQCLRHLMKRCQEILQTATGIAARFPQQGLELIEAAFAVRREHEAGGLTADQMVDAALTLGCRLEELAQGRFTYEPNRTLAQFLLKHATQWFWFLIDPEVDATNYQAEQAIRPAVVNRKVWGGNRTDQGAEAQSILMSVFRTCTQAGRRAIDFLVQVLCAPRPGPQLLAGR